MANAKIITKVYEEVRSGLVSSVFAEALLFPLDTVKLRQQVNGGNASQILRDVLKQDGVRGVFRGLLGRLIQTVTSNVGFFIWQTIFVQWALRYQQRRQEQLDALADKEEGLPTRRLSKRRSSKSFKSSSKSLSTWTALAVNMLAQQVNRLLTTPVDVVANVNQADPTSRGFFHTFLRLARTGGVDTLYRGLGVSLLLSFNPALMFTLVGKLTNAVVAMRSGRGEPGPLGAGDMFWISGVSKGVATVVTYPLIRAKAVMQAGKNAPDGLWLTLINIAKNEGSAGLYSGVWMLSYKTVLFNSLMMSLKQKLEELFAASDLQLRLGLWARASAGSLVQKISSGGDANSKYRPNVVCSHKGKIKPWECHGRVVYIDGSWSFLHDAQEYIIQEAARRGAHLVVGVHNDQCIHEVTGEYPQECFTARLARLVENEHIHSILQDAPWEMTEELIRELNITLVVSGTFNKVLDTVTPTSPKKPDTPKLANPKDPYSVPKRMKIFEEVESLNLNSEHDAWVSKATRVLFSNVDASIDWRILVSEKRQPVFGSQPGYESDVAGEDSD